MKILIRLLLFMLGFYLLFKGSYIIGILLIFFSWFVQFINKTETLENDIDEIDFQLDVVGESFYNENLESLGDGCNFVATLIPYKFNGDDAVKVEIQKKIVGHLSKETVPKYIKQFGKNKSKHPAKISSYNNRYGVKLALEI